MKKFFVGIKGFIKEERGVLLIRHNEGHWDIPGGRMDGDETFEDTLRREISEEVPGAALTAVKELQDATRLHKDIKPDTSLVLIYFLVDAKVPQELEIGDEHADFLWVKDKKDIPKDDIHPKMVSILEGLL